MLNPGSNQISIDEQYLGIFTLSSRSWLVCMLGGGVKSTKEQEEWAAGTKYPQSLLHGSLKCHRKFFFGWLQDITSKVWKVGPRSHDTQAMQSLPTEVEDYLPRSWNNQVAFQGALRIQWQWPFLLQLFRASYTQPSHVEMYSLLNAHWGPGVRHPALWPPSSLLLVLISHPWNEHRWTRSCSQG